MLRDVLGGLRALHANNICHGCVNLQSVLVEKVDEQYRGRLDFNPFTTPVRFLLFVLMQHSLTALSSGVLKIYFVLSSIIKYNITTRQKGTEKKEEPGTFPFRSWVELL